MSNTVYTFCRTNTNSNGTSKPTKSYLATQDKQPSVDATFQWKSPTEDITVREDKTVTGSGTVTEAGYSFRSTPVESQTKTLEFTESEFPTLSKGPATAPTKAASSCWSNPEKREIIKDPFTSAPVVPRQDLPPLFAKVKKTAKVQFVDEDDSDYYNLEYEDIPDYNYDEVYPDNSEW
jgi:hypothetical protein